MSKVEIITFARNENENRIFQLIPHWNVFRADRNNLWSLTGFQLHSVQFDLHTLSSDKITLPPTCSSFERFNSGLRLDRTHCQLIQICCDMHFRVHCELFTIVVFIVPRNLLTFWVTPASLYSIYIVYVCANTFALIEQLACRCSLSILYLTLCASDRCSQFICCKLIFKFKRQMVCATKCAPNVG